MTQHLNADLLPDNEESRLNKLYRYEILDTPAELTFEKIAVLAAQIFETPIAQINFVDKDRVFFKSNISPVNVTEIPRKDSFCAIAILNEDITVFENMLDVPTLQENTFVTMENGVRFYAGAPLRTKEGLQLGTVCVLDVQPRNATPKQLAMLKTLSEVVMDELEMRLIARNALRTQTDMINRIVHDLKNPNTTIKLSAELLQMKADDPEMVKSLSKRIINSANAVLGNINNMLDVSRLEEGNGSLRMSELDLAPILQQAKENFELVATSKDQQINLKIEPDLKVSGDPVRLLEIFENLISNALKYSMPGTDVQVSAFKEDNKALITVTDAGLGMDETDMGKLFIKFARLSAVPTGKEHSNGLGLFLVKTMTELHKGKAWATSPGKGQGSSFYISLPLISAD